MRVAIDLPEHFHFATELPVLAGHINLGGHLGNDAVMGLMNEARFRYLRSRGIAENDIERGLAMVNVDVAIQFQGEAFHGDVVKLEVAAAGFHRCGFDLLYRLSEAGSGRRLASAKTAHLLMALANRRATEPPPGYFDALRADL